MPCTGMSFKMAKKGDMHVLGRVFGGKQWLERINVGNVLVFNIVCDLICYIFSNRIYPGISPRGNPNQTDQLARARVICRPSSQSFCHQRWSRAAFSVHCCILPRRPPNRSIASAAHLPPPYRASRGLGFPVLSAAGAVDR